MRTLKWRGKDIQVPESKVNDLAQMGYDYHQKLQQHAAERQTWEQREAQFQQAFQEINNFLGDRQRIGAYLRQLEQQGGTQGAAAGAAADALEEGAARGLSPQQVEQMIQQRVAQAQQMNTQQLVAFQQQLQVQALAQDYRQNLDSFIEGLQQEMPELRAIRDVGDILKYKASLAKPRDVDAARDIIGNLAKEYAASIREQGRNMARQGGGNPQYPSRGIEPPGGAAVMPPQPPGPKGKISDPAFKELVTQDILRLMSRS